MRACAYDGSIPIVADAIDIDSATAFAWLSAHLESVYRSVVILMKQGDQERPIDKVPKTCLKREVCAGAVDVIQASDVGSRRPRPNDRDCSQD
jgi:hypothetical protein